MRDGDNSIILFRYHDKPEVARERIRILRAFNPGMRIYVLDGGYPLHFERRKKIIQDVADGVWPYKSDRTPSWKWRHTYQLVKDWYREVGSTLDFDYVYSWEYDLLALLPLTEIYPQTDQYTLALGACTPLTDELGQSWWWTGQDISRLYREFSYEKFSDHMMKTYGLRRQAMVCLGPGPLFPRSFLDAWATTEDVSLVHEEILYPAYAEALGFQIVDHGMNPGFTASEEDLTYFNCAPGMPVTPQMVLEQVPKPDGRRVFHPVKEQITLVELRSSGLKIT